MNLPKISISRPPFSPRFFIYFLLGLVILVLLAEGGYYFWVQREAKTQNPVIARQEGVFSYVNLPDGTTQKMILGRVEGIDGNLLTIKTDNNKTAHVLFTGENLLIADLTSSEPVEKMGTIADLLIGDEVTISDIYSDDKGQITAKFLVIVRSANM